jgi:hypothetical protein
VQAADCAVPGDGTPLRRALLKVKYLPEAEAWELAARKTAPVQYMLDVAAPVRIEGRCYWPIEARSAGKLWNTFYATSRGEELRVAGPDGRPLTLEAWRKTIR